ncbi:hypothetical protein AaE_002383, partial [Aphanomyces astaci]
MAPLVVFTSYRWRELGSNELESGIIDGNKSDAYPLLVEVFYRLCRDAGQKIEKARMLQEWERVVHRKLADNWQREFQENPMPTTHSFDDVSVRDRARILHALCEWRVHASDITKFIAGLSTSAPLPPKDDKHSNTTTTVITYASLRPEALGEDDDGSIYWYFHDGCWVYAETASAHRKPPLPVYHVRYATPSKIRLSTHFELENNAGLDTLVESTLVVAPSSSSLKRKRSSSKKEHKSDSKKKSKRSRHHRSSSRHHRSSRHDDDEEDPAVPKQLKAEIHETIDDTATWHETLPPSTANDRALRLTRRTSSADNVPEGHQKRRLAMER